MYKLLFLLLFVSASVFAQNIEQTYRNPVIKGDLPDPTIIRVGEDYYAAGTTSEFAPSYPIYHSRDLINWERIGAVFSDPPAWIKNDCWAPELYYNEDNQTFYVYYTARKKKDNISCIGVATTKDIRKGFSDHGPMIEWGSEAIDAFVFKDDDGKRYITWKAYGLDERPIEILCSELSADGLKLVGEHFTLTDYAKGWTGGGVEGQIIHKRNGYYYHFNLVGGCCDNRCDYRINVARSKSLRGPWEQNKLSPILEGGGTWRCSGHGTMVQTPDGRYFYLYHAYHAYDFEYVGRQGLLDELLWDDASGWPYFRFGNNPTVQAPVPFKGTVQKRSLVFDDNFKTNQYNTYWQWDMMAAKPETSKGTNGLKITNTSSDMCFYGINAQTANYTMETEVLNSGSNFKGLTIYGCKTDYIAYGVENNKVRLYQVTKGVKSELASYDADLTRPVHLKIEVMSGRLLRFLFSTDKSTYKTYPTNEKQFDVPASPQWGRGLRLGFLVGKTGGDKTGQFVYFKVTDKY